ncbi:predicted protein [Histoplasma capsulatum var. duboisii H88]|uniref:Predicted protein n=1 Tax=Ajellomyces capsulatus (strain H88) TaxID=544711 RepID=F0UCM5_AJEC8|nr:predicted protein [Histoplasma capsulatum var. duboisii H88]
MQTSDIVLFRVKKEWRRREREKGEDRESNENRKEVGCLCVKSAVEKWPVRCPLHGKWGQAALKAVERLARCLARTTHHAEPSSLTDGTLSSSRYTGSSPGGACGWRLCSRQR